MKTIIVVCSLIICFTAAILCFLIHRYKSYKKDLQKTITDLETQYKDKNQAIGVIEHNIETEKINLEKLYQIIEKNKEDQQLLLQNINFLNGQIAGAKSELAALDEIFAKNKQQILDAEAQKQQILESIEEKFQKDLENLIENYEDKSEEYEKQLNDLREKRDAAIRAAIEEYESQNDRRFYMLQLSQNDIDDIKVLKQFETILHNKEILGKLIYKTYMEKAYTDLIGRVLNKEDFSGIYKITNELNQMCYIGQAANVKKRWQQHIKRAVGAEPLVNNKLYPAMQRDGIENFSFEVIDRCDKDKLNEREQYWQKFYQAKSYGYSIK